MIVHVLRSKSILQQAGVLILLALAAYVPTCFMDVVIIEPEDATVFYQFIAGWIITLPVWLQRTILSVLLIWVIISLARLCTQLGISGRRMVIPLFAAELFLLSIPQNISIHPQLVAMLFFIPALKVLLGAAGSRYPMVNLVNAGLLVSLASLISLPFLFFFPAFFMAMLIFRLYRWNYWGILMTGLAIPWIYFIVINWVFDLWILPDPDSLLAIWISGILYFFPFMLSSFTVSNYIVIFLLLVFLVIAGWTIYTRLDQRVIAIRYLYRALLWMVFTWLLILLISGGMILQHFQVIGFFTTPVVGDYLLSTRKPRTVSVVIILLLLIIIASHTRLF